MTTQKVLQHYENVLTSVVNEFGTAETEALYDNGDYLVMLKAALSEADDRGATCGAELADKIQEYPALQYYINLMWLRS